MNHEDVIERLERELRSLLAERDALTAQARKLAGELGVEYQPQATVTLSTGMTPRTLAAALLAARREAQAARVECAALSVRAAATRPRPAPPAPAPKTAPPRLRQFDMRGLPREAFHFPSGRAARIHRRQ